MIDILSIYPSGSFCKNFKNDADFNIDYEICMFQFHHILSAKTYKKKILYGISLLQPYFIPNGVNNEDKLYIVNEKTIKTYNKYFYYIYYQFLYEFIPNIFINFSVIKSLNNMDINMDTVFFIQVENNRYTIPFLNFNYPLNKEEILFVLPKFFPSVNESIVNELMNINDYIYSQNVIQSLL